MPNRKIIGSGATGKRAELEPDFVKKETKKVALDNRMLRTNIRYRKTKT